MAIGSLGNASFSSINQASLAELRQTQAATMAKDMDTDKSGTVSKDEFAAFGERMQANASKATGAVTANAPTAPSADQMFTAADKNNDSALSIDELSSMMAEAEAKRGSSTTSNASVASAGAGNGPPPARGGGGPPPGGGMSGAGGSASNQSTNSSTSSTTSTESTDPADANKDGVVTTSEKLLYAMTHPTASTASTTSTGTANGASSSTAA